MKKAISAQKTKMYLENPNAPAAATGLVTSISKSAPATAVFDDITKLRNGASVLLIGTGFASLDGRSWVVQNINPETKTGDLAGSDTSNETDDFSGTAAWVLRAYIDVCAVSYQINQNPAADIDTTTLCDDQQTFLVGFSDPGTLTFDFFIDPTDPAYQALQEAQKDGIDRMFEIRYRNGAVRSLPVIVQSVNESGGVNQAIQGAATLRVTGTPVLTMPVDTPVDSYVLIPIVSPLEGIAPVTATLTINEAGGVATGFKIDWKDGSAVVPTTAHIVTHEYSEAGTFQPTVVATIANNDTAPFRSQTAIVVAPAAEAPEALADAGAGHE
jgi:Lambda phage tail tube protein, TTP